MTRLPGLFLGAFIGTILFPGVGTVIGGLIGATATRKKLSEKEL